MDTLHPATLDLNREVGRDRLQLELVGFWRMYKGGGRCLLRWDQRAGAWRGTVEDVADAEPARHAPTTCSYTRERLEDFVRLSECRQLSATAWLLRYREPA